jgi:GMP synthase-like glutamine amidotransferase
MQLAVLMTNTDESEFAQRHPKDGEKFADLVHLVRPEWQVTSFSVKDDVFPDDIDAFDGVMITGSPASVHDTDPWVARLLDLIREIYAARIPMFGACYGHQAIALALGGTVEANLAGWVFGVAHSEVCKQVAWMSQLPSPFAQYAAHVEAVTGLPDGAEVVSVSEACAITGFHIENKVFTTQNHPEMSHAFMSALIEEYAPNLPVGVGDAARASMLVKADTQIYAQSIARFFETHKT